MPLPVTSLKLLATMMPMLASRAQQELTSIATSSRYARATKADHWAFKFLSLENFPSVLDAILCDDAWYGTVLYLRNLEVWFLKGMLVLLEVDDIPHRLSKSSSACQCASRPDAQGPGE